MPFLEFRQHDTEQMFYSQGPLHHFKVGCLGYEGRTRRREGPPHVLLYFRSDDNAPTYAAAELRTVPLSGSR